MDKNYGVTLTREVDEFGTVTYRTDDGYEAFQVTGEWFRYLLFGPGIDVHEPRHLRNLTSLRAAIHNIRKEA